MFVLVNRDLEITCDEMVIRHFGAETKTAYAYSIIGMAEQRSKFTPLYNGFAKNAAEERIVSIMKYKKSTITAIVLAVLLVAGATTAFTASALNDDNNVGCTAGGMLKVGKYMQTSGDPNKYIEVYDDGTLQIFGFDMYEWYNGGSVEERANYVEFENRTKEEQAYMTQIYTRFFTTLPENGF